MDTCNVDDCQGAVKGRGMCSKHYERWRKYGDTRPRKKTGRPAKPKKPCSIDGCKRPMSTRGWCQTHYMRWRRTGDTGTGAIATHEPVEGSCKEANCKKPAKGRGWCGLHYNRWRKYGDTKPRRKTGRPAKPKKPCAVDDCTRDQSARGWCHAHYMSWMRYGNPLGSKHAPVTEMPVATPELSGFLAARRARLARQNRTAA